MTYERETDQDYDGGLSAPTLVGAEARSLASTVWRAGAVAAALSMTVSGVAYAAAVSSVPEAPALGAAEAALALPAVGEASSTPQAQAVSFRLVVDGEGREVSTSAGSWGQALLEAGAGVDTVAGDRVSVALDGVPVSGETVVVDRVSVSAESKEDREPYGTVEEKTDELDKGERKVRTPGVDGVTRTTYVVRTVGGQEVSREVSAQVVATAKVDEVVQVGTREKKQETSSSSGSQTGGRTEASGGSGSSGGSASTAPAYAASGTSAADAQATARSMLASYGWGEGEFSCLVNLWNRESGWNYQAHNPYSGAHGIPQALPGSKMASAGSDWRTNPATQIKWGLGYIQGRYGSPCSAWAHSERAGWY